MEENEAKRNYSTISPSAKALLLLKSETPIPFAKEAAKRIGITDAPAWEADKNPLYWARVLHFENRYWSIDQLLHDRPVKNILELSSGFSFRGLAMAKEENVHYVDTDLPDIISVKKNLVQELNTHPEKSKGFLEITELNALDEDAFLKLVDQFAPGELAIVNEGLLMYLNTSEKEKLCGIIRRVLQQRGGYWITADIYVKRASLNIEIKFSDRLEQFFKEHQIEENKFESFEAAKSFFEQQGFVVDKEAQPDFSKLTALHAFLQSTSNEQMGKMRKAGNMQATWRLKLAE